MRRAFTLIELLVVVAIIAVLMAILLPSLSAARESAKKLTCLSNLRQMQASATMYAQEWSGWYLPAYTVYPSAGNAAMWSNDETCRTWLNLQPFNSGGAADVELRRLCPNALYARANQSTWGGKYYPMDKSYGRNFAEFMDWRFPQYLYPSASSGNKAPTYIAYKMNLIMNPSAKLAWADALSGVIRPGGYNLATPGPSSAYTFEPTTSAITVPLPSNNMTAYRHNGGVNIAFYDGHAEWMPRKAVDVNLLVTNPKLYEIWYAYGTPPVSP